MCVHRLFELEAPEKTEPLVVEGGVWSNLYIYINILILPWTSQLTCQVYKIGLTRSTTAADTVVPKTGLTSSGRWCWSHSKFAVLGQTAAKMNPLRWSKRMTVSELAEDLGKYLQTDPRGVKILFDEENEKSYSDQVAAVLELQDMIRKAWAGLSGQCCC